MEKLENLFAQLKTDSEERFGDFKIEEISALEVISDEAYLEKPIWLGGDAKYACVFIDLNRSSEISNLKQKSTVAKIYDYFTQNAVDILSIEGMRAEYIDIKGDGVFGLFEEPKSIIRAFVAAVTFKTFFANEIASRFKTDYDISLNCKLSMDFDKILVRKIGRRKFYNEVWAGKLINNTFKIADLDRVIRSKKGVSASDNLLIVSETIFEKLKEKEEYTILSCGHSNGIYNGSKTNLWTEFRTDTDSAYDETVYYLPAKWCKECGDEYISNLLK